MAEFIDYVRRLQFANQVAERFGLPLVTFSEPGADAFVTEEGDECTCGGCEQELPAGRNTYSKRVSYEYDEWETYCSPACANGANHVGLWTDFLERMGWTVYHAENERRRNGPYRWALMPWVDVDSPEHNKIIAREGDARWFADAARARVLAALVVVLERPPALPPYRGPSHGVEVLERVAQRETLRLGLPWTDMPLALRNRFMDSAARVLDETLRCLWREPMTAELGTVPADAVRSLRDLGRVEAWTDNRYGDCLQRAQRLRHYRDFIEGRER
ncbi:hypothetical protein [Azospirillum sp.]|uniref:hypothetical protein n=1 Tax=Azospirillum sp. TaxID=34012 RepID=UPI003D73288E